MQGLSPSGQLTSLCSPLPALLCCSKGVPVYLSVSCGGFSLFPPLGLSSEAAAHCRWWRGSQRIFCLSGLTRGLIFLPSPPSFPAQETRDTVGCRGSGSLLCLALSLSYKYVFRSKYCNIDFLKCTILLYALFHYRLIYDTNNPAQIIRGCF